MKDKRFPGSYYGLNTRSPLYPGLAYCIPDALSYGSVNHLHEVIANQPLSAVSSPDWTLDADYGQAINIPGSGARWRTNEVVSYQFGETFTITFWFRCPNTASGTQHIITQEQAGVGDNAYFARLLSGATIQFQTKNTTGTTAFITTTATFSNDTWYKIHLRKTATHIEDCINGVYEKQSALTGNLADITGDYLVLGSQSNGSNPFTGQLRGVMAWNYALPDDLIAYDYLNPFDLYLSPFEDLYAPVPLTGNPWYQFLQQRAVA